MAVIETVIGTIKKGFFEEGKTYILPTSSTELAQWVGSLVYSTKNNREFLGVSFSEAKDGHLKEIIKIPLISSSGVSLFSMPLYTTDEVKPESAGILYGNEIELYKRDTDGSYIPADGLWKMAGDDMEFFEADVFVSVKEIPMQNIGEVLPLALFHINDTSAAYVLDKLSVTIKRKINEPMEESLETKTGTGMVVYALNRDMENARWAVERFLFDIKQGFGNCNPLSCNSVLSLLKLPQLTDTKLIDNIIDVIKNDKTGWTQLRALQLNPDLNDEHIDQLIKDIYIKGEEGSLNIKKEELIKAMASLVKAGKGKYVGEMFKIADLAIYGFNAKEVLEKIEHINTEIIKRVLFK